MPPTPLRQPLPASLSFSPRRNRGPLDVVVPAAPRRRGRPPLATREQVQHQIRDAAGTGRLFRVHIEQPALYARARRLWGSWAAALAEAGIDHGAIVSSARARSLETRRARRTVRANP